MKTQVKAFIPIDITDEMLLDSSIAEPFENEPAWSPDVEYAEFSEISVIDGNSHLVYQSLQSINKGHEPATSPTWWEPKSNTNRFRMFDFYQGDPSVASSPMWFSIRPKQRINAIVLKNLKANVVEIVVRSGVGGPIVYTLDAYLLARQATRPYEWCFKPFVYDKTVSTFNIPPVGDPVIWIKMDDPSGTCELERFGIGMSVDIGEVEWDSVSEDENYSEITRDKFGRAKFNPIPSMDGLEMTLDLDPINVNSVRQFKRLSDARPVVWSAMQDVDAYREMHILVGHHQRFKVTAKNHRQAKVDLILKGI